ncbi:energy transducer TonB [Flavobacterium macrobrachii]|jgi:TonB family protein|uniref:Energy transducer TonB n=1 Tax=Flavobacterium macrobrachii TaxID=591204 RepID=A0ABS2CWF2_9FLAO|nr:energy transducer TonB [Flavobacterium macrobrachii]MBM6499277.1 energy transducer TonB [Flavobacterium macrobrachii]
MKFLETPEEKKSFTITSVIFVILFLLFFFFGLTYMDPPPENGIAINFGTSDVGQGEVQPLEPIKSSPQPEYSKPEKAVEEDIATQDNSDAPVIKKSEVKKPVKEVKEEVKPKTPSKNATSALESLINGPKSTGVEAGHGNDGIPGDKGDPNGDRYANSFYGNGTGNGAGNGTSWGLNGRKLSTPAKEVQDCNEEGRVVVQVTVNRSGNVIAAKYSKGTTNTNPCLVNPALSAARKFKWQPDSNAPETQIGFIVINFKLGE